MVCVDDEIAVAVRVLRVSGLLWVERGWALHLVALCLEVLLAFLRVELSEVIGLCEIAGLAGLLDLCRVFLRRLACEFGVVSRGHFALPALHESLDRLLISLDPLMHIEVLHVLQHDRVLLLPLVVVRFLELEKLIFLVCQVERGLSLLVSLRVLKRLVAVVN